MARQDRAIVTRKKILWTEAHLCSQHRYGSARIATGVSLKRPPQRSIGGGLPAVDTAVAARETRAVVHQHTGTFVRKVWVSVDVTDCSDND